LPTRLATAGRSRNPKRSGVGVWAYRRIGVKILAKLREVDSQKHKGHRDEKPRVSEINEDQT
jgi:hypothetical protein